MQVINTFRDLEESNILQSYMKDALKEISKACQAFEAKESAPPIAGIKSLLQSFCLLTSQIILIVMIHSGT